MQTIRRKDNHIFSRGKVHSSGRLSIFFLLLLIFEMNVSVDITICCLFPRLFQVEYAIRAIEHAGAALGIVAGNEGVILAAEKKIVSKLLDNSNRRSEKMFQLDDHIACAVAGITADANILINSARLSAQRYMFTYQTQVPVENLVRSLTDIKQGYTQFGGMRPFGVSLLYAGWDRYHGFQLYHSDPSGNYGGWKATAIGANNQNAQSILKQDWNEDLTLKDALVLAVKVMSKTMDSTTLSSEKLEFSTLVRKDGKVIYHVLTDAEVDQLLKDAEAVTKKEENE